MKKTILLSAIALAAVVSCQKESAGVLENNSVLSFTASYPQVETEKTVLNSDKTVSWTVSDTISVHCTGVEATGAEFINSAAALSTFTGVAPAANNYYALSPASALVGWKPSDSKNYPHGVMFMIPDKQTATKGSWDPAASILYGTADGTQKAFTFHHVTGYLKFTITATSGSIKSVEVGAAVGLAGQIAVTDLTNLKGSKETGNVEYKSITLTTEDGSAMEPGDYYVALRARDYTAGLTLTFTNTDDKKASVNISGKKTVTNGKVHNLGTVSGLEFPADGAPAIGTVTGGGIVSYVAADHYLLMSLDDAKKRWTTNEAYGSVSIDGMKNDDGASNTSAFLKYLSDNSYSIDDFPAIKWATEKGEGWYLPSITELQSIWSAVTGAEGGWDAFNSALEKASGTVINNVPSSAWYLWSSTESAKDKMSGLKVNTSGAIGVSALGKFAAGGTTRNVRAIKKVSL